jgi:hypothetical protein
MSGGIGDLDFDAFSFQVGAQLEKTKRRGPHPKARKKFMRGIDQKNFHSVLFVVPSFIGSEDFRRQ